MPGMRYQPQGRAVASPAWRNLGLESFTVFQATDFEAAGPSGLVRSGTGHTVRVTPQGIGVSQNGGNNTWTVGAKGKTIGVGNQFTVAVAFQLNATGQSQKYIVMDGASADQTAVIYGYVANTVEFFAQGYTGTDPRTGSGIVVNDTLPHVVVYTYDGTNWRGYLDGVEKFSVTRTFSLFGLAGTPTGFIGGATATGGVINATFFAHARFSKGIPKESARALSASMWQALTSSDEEETLDVLVASGGSGPTIVSADGSSIGASSLSSIAQAIFNTFASSQAAATNGAASVAIAGSSGSSVGSGSLSGSTVSLFYSGGSSYGTTSNTANCVSIYLTTGASSCSATVSGNAYSIWSVQANTVGTAVGSGSGVSLFPVAGGSAGTSSVSGTGAALTPASGSADGSAIGTSNAAAIASAFYNAIASAVGSASSSASGASISSSIANASGLASSTGSAAARMATNAGSFGTSVANAGGVILACATGAATGLASVGGLSVAIYGAGGISVSAAQVQAIAAFVATVIGNSGGKATVSGVTEGGLHYTASGDKFNITITLSPYLINIQTVKYHADIN
jgi:hypothetical protein